MSSTLGPSRDVDARCRSAGFDDPHEWLERDGWSVCSRCGMVRNYDRETPCRGTMPEIQHRMDKQLNARARKLCERLVMAVGVCDISRIEAADVIEADFNAAGVYPTDEELSLLVFGDDEGVVPPELQKKFPNINSLLEYLLT